MIFGSSRLRGATTLGSVLVLAMAIGCGSSADSFGTGGTTGHSGGGSSGGGTSGGSGNSVAGSANGQAGTSPGGANNSEMGGSSGDEGGAGNDDSAGEGGSGGSGDDNSSGGASEGGQSGGEGGGAGETPDAWTECTDSNECVLTPMTCCGSCGAVTPEDAAAVNAQYLEEFRDATCGGPSICPACIMDDDPRVGTYCNDGHCIVELALD